MKRKRKIIPVLEELAKKMEVLSVEEQRRYIGGGDGSPNNPYTHDEYFCLQSGGCWYGGYVEGQGYTDAYGYWGGSSGSYGDYGNNGSSGNSGSYGGSSGETYTQEQFFSWSGDWLGGYVEGLGYVPADVIIYGSSGSSSGSGWNITDAVNYLTNNAALSSTGYCARSVRQAIEAGGLSTDGRPNSACDYDTYLSTIGFAAVGSADYIPQAGDIVVHEATSGHPYGHIAMYNGSVWVSDFVQSDMFGGSAYRNNPNYTIFRWNP